MTSHPGSRSESTVMTLNAGFFDVLELSDDTTCRWSVQTSITALDIWLLQVFSDDIVKIMVKI